MLLDKLPVAKAPMILVLIDSNIDAEALITQTVAKYARLFKVKSGNMTKEFLDIVIELCTVKKSELVYDLMMLAVVVLDALHYHDGEATF